MRALAITLIAFVSVLLLIFFYVNNNSVQKEEEAGVEVIIQELYNNAMTKFNEGDPRDAIRILDKMRYDPYTPDSIHKVRERILEEAWQSADASLFQEQYEQAAKQYNLVRDFYQDRGRVDEAFLGNLAKLNRQSGLYEEAIKTHNMLIDQSVNPIRHWTRIGEIYLFDMKNLPMAEKMLVRATSRIKKNYIRNYGRTYPLKVKPNRTPDYHYEAYYAMAHLLHLKNQDEEAVKLLDWAIFLRDSHHEAYQLRGTCLRAAGRNSAACRNWQRAQQLGATEAAALLSEYCL